eukprot:Partr_v1_DN27432_c0_g1_i1_m71651 putative heme lyase
MWRQRASSRVRAAVDFRKIPKLKMAILDWFSSSSSTPPSPPLEAPLSTTNSPSGCPVKHRDQGGCPVKPGESNLQPHNNIPILSQSPSEGQKYQLPTDRQVSTIPRANDSVEDEKWVYPSQQQFYNALKRKNHETYEEDVASIVSIHNDVNERSWQEILRWERMHSDSCCEPKLKKFEGRPNEMTPKARFLSFFGLTEPPFDRHDWIVDRCGKEVRYVIDYYHGSNLPGTAVLSVDARPAIDDLQSAIDRVKMIFSSGSSAE